ncbi:MAG TPA: RQC domain-containing protein, partial [Tenuifilaceae bacterium]|nr:RQC domain-containing protein [Tenuifilaceae bacterium]
CGTCDNCLHPKTQFEGQEQLQMVLETIIAINQKFKADHVINILMGNVTAAVKSYKHNKLDTFGEGAEKDQRFWNSVIRQSLVMKFIDKDIENYGLLFITPKGQEFLKKPYDIMFSLDNEFEEGEDDESIGMPMDKGGAADDELLNMLKDLRKKVAKKKNLPPFVIFQDPSLEDMSIQYPITLEELQNISGVGAGKAKRFGQEFIDLIKSYVEDKDIIRPQDMVVKSVANKSLLKVYVIQSIDRKMDLNDIAEAKNLEMNELLNEIEAIVNSGTKINLDYYIDKVVDEDKQDEIFDYFQNEAESESIEDAISALGEGDYTEEEIRLMRIKFMSEMGN